MYACMYVGVDGGSGGELPTSSVGLPGVVRECGSAVVEHLPQPRERALRLVRRERRVAPM